MGMFDTVVFEGDRDLPEFDNDEINIGWQTKTLGQPTMSMYKVSEDGKLFKKESNIREKTDEEKLEEAKEYGYDSWDEYYQAWKNKDDIIPEDLPFMIQQTVLESEEWVGKEQHGSFEIHSYDDDYWYSYELRFTHGYLDDIILLDKIESDTPL